MKTIEHADLLACADAVAARLCALNATHIRFWGLDDEGLDASLVAAVTLAEAGTIGEIAARCIAAGEEADVLDALGARLATVDNEGALVWLPPYEPSETP